MGGEIDSDFHRLEVPLNNLKRVSWNSTPIQEVPNLAAYNQHLNLILYRMSSLVELWQIPPCLFSGIRTIFWQGSFTNSLNPGYLSPRRQIVTRLKKFWVGLEMASMSSIIFSIFVGPSKEKILTVTCLFAKFFKIMYLVNCFPSSFLAVF